VEAAQVARLATIDPDGRPHLVPIVFALAGDTLYTAVDAKPKRSRRLRRIENARERPDVTVLVDEYEDDWSRLWWVRLRGGARVLDSGEEAGRALELLRMKYAQYRRTPLGLPVLAVDVEEWRGWEADPGRRATRYWIGVVSRSHVLRGVEGGFAQLSHGKEAPLRRLSAGDWLVYYSPRTSHPDGEPLRAFTAVGRVADDQVFQADAGGGFRPWRRRVQYRACCEAAAAVVLDDLEVVPDRRRWGLVVRRGLVEIGEGDFRRIAAAMGAEL
jgi:PPOX class probable F420-dependent enzyme